MKLQERTEIIEDHRSLTNKFSKFFSICWITNGKKEKCFP